MDGSASDALELLVGGRDGCGEQKEEEGAGHGVSWSEAEEEAGDSGHILREGRGNGHGSKPGDTKRRRNKPDGQVKSQGSHRSRLFMTETPRNPWHVHPAHHLALRLPRLPPLPTGTPRHRSRRPRLARMAHRRDRRGRKAAEFTAEDAKIAEQRTAKREKTGEAGRRQAARPLLSSLGCSPCFSALRPLRPLR